MADEPTETTPTPEEEAEAAATQEESGRIEAEAAQREEAIQHFKGKLGEEVAERRKLESKLAELEGRLTEQSSLLAQGQSQQEQVDPYAVGEDEADEIRNDPVLVLGKIRQGQALLLETLQSQIVDLLTSRGQQDDARFSELSQKLVEFNPEHQAWKPVLEKLREEEVFKDLETDVLIAIAQEMGMKPAYENRGSPGGGQRPRGTSMATKATPEEKRLAAAMFFKLTGDKEKVKRLMLRKFKEEWKDDS